MPHTLVQLDGNTLQLGALNDVAFARWLAAPGFHWLAAKVFLVLFCFLWFRATFPRYRYDQLMRLGWKVFIPVTLVWIFVLAVWMMTPLWPW